LCSFAASVGAKHYHTSAKLNKGLDELFLDLSKRTFSDKFIDLVQFARFSLCLPLSVVSFFSCRMCTFSLGFSSKYFSEPGMLAARAAKTPAAPAATSATPTVQRKTSPVYTCNCLNVIEKLPLSSPPSSYFAGLSFSSMCRERFGFALK
jgi:hypothetical protein